MIRKIFIFIIFCMVLGFLAIFAGHHLSIHHIAERETYLRTAISNAPWKWFGIGLLLYSLISLLPGTSGKSIVCGYLFGFWQSLFIVIVGLTIAAMISFFVCRYGIRHIIEKRFSNLLVAMESAIRRDGAFYLLTLRMAHVPFSLINYCSAVTAISGWTFCWTTLVGLIPGTILFVYLGANLPTLHELAAHGAAALVSPKLIGGLVATAVFPLVVKYILFLTRNLRHRKKECTKADSCNKESK